ncbi:MULTISPECIES: response regulator transcription factor [Sphingosinicellaceae]|uniref:response regulator transcription factor n=1 Tax=Sphingosinicellaceae TaxID=2820280 RepID=UPI001C1E5011|nr:MULTISPECIES: response regulator transcription factor [Polymorphobacter]QYE33082.1 response regulator transcription factor [Polymorphobacter sp. PAMC 29334]UAJ12322.1 response regulator transcription factor [Polymorphobacter megasporae]
MTHILLIEDDAGTAHEITLELTGNGYGVTHRATAAEGLAAALDDTVDLLIVDRQLPDGEGLELIARLRSQGRRTPALVLSALGSLDDRVRGLRAGGDDYLPKPFALVELVARIEALLRRPNETRDTRLIVGPLDLDLLAGTATRSGRRLELLPRELKLLDYLIRRPDRIVTRSMLLRDVWGYTFEPNSNVVDVHIGRLRRKVDGDGEPQLIRNVRGQGYVFNVVA